MKLEGLKVLDLSLFLPGPHLTMMMADHGADVIKIEPPQGEPVRSVGLRQNGHSVWFRNTHRNKRCITLNLKMAEARTAFLALARDADVIVEAFRPGIVDRLGVGYAAVSAINPRIVYCSISAFGQHGPLSQSPAHDLAVQAEAGLLSVNLGADGQPAMPGLPAADMAASLMALSGILMALLRREQTGRGDYLDIAMYDSLLAWTPNVMGPVFAEDRAADTLVAVFRVDDLSHPQRRYKVDINAQQLALTGAAVTTSAVSVVIVEGGPLHGPCARRGGAW